MTKVKFTVSPEEIKIELLADLRRRRDLAQLRATRAPLARDRLKAEGAVQALNDAHDYWYHADLSEPRP